MHSTETPSEPCIHPCDVISSRALMTSSVMAAPTEDAPAVHSSGVPSDGKSVMVLLDSDRQFKQWLICFRATNTPFGDIYSVAETVLNERSVCVLESRASW